MEQYAELIWAHWGLEDGATRSEFVAEWVRRINAIFTPHWGGSDVWEGAGIDIGSRIVWNRAGQNAIQGLLGYALLAPLEEWRGMGDDAREAAYEWLDKGWSEIRRGKAPYTIEGYLGAVGAPWRDFSKRYVRAVIRAREDEPRDPTDVEVRDHAASQLVRLAVAATEIGDASGAGNAA